MASLLLRRTLLPIGLALVTALALALLLAIGWMGAPGQDVADLVRYLLTSGLISLGLGIAGVLWLRRGPARLWVQVAVSYTLGVGIALFNIFLTAQLMFISQHDLPLLVLLLLFAAVVSLGMGYALARTLAQRVTALHQNAQTLAQGNLHVRVPELGSDELGTLAREFNKMAAQLAASAAERDQLEAARREMLAAISHDLRTPLTSLRVMTEALADGLVNDPMTTQRYLATMRSQINHLSSMIDDLFELAQLEAGALQLELQRVLPGDLVSDTIEGLHPQAIAQQIDLHGKVAADVGPLLVAPQKIERLLYNLVTNALRHTPRGGSVTISVTPDERRDATGNKHMRPSSVVFEVADTGEGIAPEDLPHVFEQFYRGEKSRSRTTGGIGLGLAIARGIVEAHGGRIWIDSVPSRGTRVYFALPIRE